MKTDPFVTDKNARALYEYLLHYPRFRFPSSVREISGRTICSEFGPRIQRFGMTDVDLRALVNHGRNELRLRICSNRLGYWIAQHPSDLLETRDHLVGRAKNLFRTVASIDLMHREMTAGFDPQGNLFSDERRAG